MRAYGTLNLSEGMPLAFAALEVATGQVITSVTQTKTRQDFIQFMSEVVAEYPNQEIHVIPDNYCTHKKMKSGWLHIHLFTFILLQPQQVG